MGSYMGHEYDEATTGAAPKPKYKVGQWVRVIKSGYEAGGSLHEAEVGDTFEVQGVSKLGVYAGGWYLWHGEFAAAFLPGDSVRVTRCNNYFAAGDTGIVVSQTGDMVTVCTDDCPIVCRSIEADKLEWLGSGEVPKAGGRKPKFKAGDRVTTSGARGEPGIGTVLGYDDDGTVRVEFETGYGICYEPEDWLTLVTPAPCPQDNERAVITDELEAAMVDAVTASFRKLYQEDDVETLTLKLDLDTSEFTKKLDAALGANRPCIVVRATAAQVFSSGEPHSYPDTASAIAEAERLARNNPGQQFDVYQRVAGRQCAVSYEMKEVA